MCRKRNSARCGRVAREPAQAFAEEFGGEVCASFDALLASGIDALYIATVQDSHADYAIAALQAGLHVLCEKPATINRPQLERVLEAARAAQRLFMEAMKPPFYPLYRKLRDASRGRSDRRCRTRAGGLLGAGRAGRSPVAVVRACGRRAARYRHLRNVSRGGLARRAARGADARAARVDRRRYVRESEQPARAAASRNYFAGSICTAKAMRC